MGCVYFGEQKSGETHGCLLHEQCALIGQSTEMPVCESCNDRLPLDDPNFVGKWRDPLVVLDRTRARTHAKRNLLAGGAAFLMGGGPSANDLPLELLARRGIWTMAVNNSAGHPRVRPQAMVCSDPPAKFSHSIWFDPGIAKFIPSPKMSGGRAKIRRRVPDGSFVLMDEVLTDCPNVWGFKRWSWLEPSDRFFLTDGACWGNHDQGCRETGQPKTVCTMLLGLRLLRYLGARKVFLVGVDFRMSPDRGYSFEQSRSQGESDSNNAQFRVVNDWLVKMEQDGVFRRFGMEIFNCFERSGLRAFPYVPFEQAVEEAAGIVEERPSLSGWYTK